uniref:Secreted protein n=1 Tax=Mesocestoides corti TaxID=53468 RepID=A0A5K3F6U1_MESCO
MSLAARILNFPLISTNIWLGLSSYLGLDVSSSMTYTSKLYADANHTHTTTASSSPRINGRLSVLSQTSSLLGS